MSRFILYTYENVEEFNLFYKHLENEGKSIHNFIFQDTQLLLENEPEVTIDISALVKYLKSNPVDEYPANLNFKPLDDTSKVIISSKLADLAMEIFCTIFKDVKPLFDDISSKNRDSQDPENNLIPFRRRVLYTYENGFQLDNIIDFAAKNEINFANFSKLNEKHYSKLKSNDEKKGIVDITTVTDLVIDKPEMIYGVEQTLDSFSHFHVIIRNDLVDEALRLYMLLFDSKKPISELLEGLSLNSDGLDDLSEEKVIRVIDLNHVELSDFHKKLSSRLFGHNDFKEELKQGIDNFVLLNRINEKKVFSIFLLGNSGLGKTEVARIIKDTLNEDTPIVKINLGNYSSKDVLNSLIGSPRGYQGMEEGELSVKINKSKAGIILCDEFEKATYQISNFFLELLEDGVFTDSMSREFNLDGYIIVFTSNINETLFNENIPPELQSRLDIVSEFIPLTKEEKIEYLNYQIQIFLENLESNDDLPKFSEFDINYFRDMDLDSTDNLRDIRRNIRERMLNRLKENLKNLD